MGMHAQRYSITGVEVWVGSGRSVKPTGLQSDNAVETWGIKVNPAAVRAGCRM